MLTSFYSYWWASLWLFLPFLVIFMGLYYNTHLVFVRIWLLFLFFLTLNLLLGYTGEDFFVILVLIAEIPVFFGFFFFYIVKNELKHHTNFFFIPQNKTRWAVFCVVLFFVCTTQKRSYVPDFTYWTPDLLLYLPSRSDFFYFYFYFFYTSNYLIFFFGLAITITTFIILFLTYQYQISEIEASAIKHNKRWVRSQDIHTQTNQQPNCIFFKI